MSYADTKPLGAVAPPAPSYPAEVGPTAPAVPHQGMIWLDDSAAPSVLKIYDNGAWATVSSRATGGIEDLSDVDFAQHAPTHGDTLVYDPYAKTWHAGAAPAHITHWSSATNYAEGATVYHNGGFFEANKANIGQRPDFRYGDASFYRREHTNGTGQFRGPYQFDAVNIVADPTVAPTVTPTTQQPHYTLHYKDDATWAVWHWNLEVPPGYRPGVDPLPTYQWHNLSSKYNQAKVKSWRTWSGPSSAFGDFVLWIYDNPRGTTPPRQRDIFWNLLEVRKDMFALHDVLALNPATGDTLTYGDDQNWHSGSPVAPLAPTQWNSPGIKGQMASDAQHVYLCVEPNEWIRWARAVGGGW